MVALQRALEGVRGRASIGLLTRRCHHQSVVLLGPACGPSAAPELPEHDEDESQEDGTADPDHDTDDCVACLIGHTIFFLWGIVDWRGRVGWNQGRSDIGGLIGFAIACYLSCGRALGRDNAWTSGGGGPWCSSLG